MRKAKTVVSLGGLHCLSLLPCFTTRTFLPSQHYNAFFLPLQYHVCRLSCSCHRLVVPWAAFRLQELKSSRRLSLLPVFSILSLHKCHFTAVTTLLRAATTILQSCLSFCLPCFSRELTVMYLFGLQEFGLYSLYFQSHISYSLLHLDFFAFWARRR